ncbi:MAG: hypothetical protein ACKV2O_16160 [Acidimicrobiales bacterium]
MKSVETGGPLALPTLVTVGGPHLPRIHASTDGGSGAALIDLRDPPFRAELLHPADPASEPARLLEAEVFRASFGVTREQFDAAYGPYDNGSLFFTVTDTRRTEVQGVARIIVDNPAGFISLNDTERTWGLTVADMQLLGAAPATLSRTWDVATLAVAPGSRQGVVSMILYQLMLRTITEIGINWLVSIQDVRVFRMLRARLNCMFEPWPSASPALYSGSVSVPVFCLAERYRTRLCVEHPDKYQRLYNATGSEDITTFVPASDEVHSLLTGSMIS